MTDSQHSFIENKGERIYPPEDEGAISCPSDDETPHRKKSTSRRKAPPPTGKRRARSGKADKHPKPITPKRPAPEPKTSPIIVKAHGRRQDLARFDPSKMYQKTAYASLAIELEGAIHTESNLIPNAIPEPFDLSDILKQLTHLGPGRARVPARNAFFLDIQLSLRNGWIGLRQTKRTRKISLGNTSTKSRMTFEHCWARKNRKTT